MIHFHKLRTQPVLKWGLFNFSENYLKSSKIPIWGLNLPNPRFYGRKKKAESDNFDANSTFSNKNDDRISRATWVEAQTALLEYLHSTRSLQFMDAENMSKNSPQCLKKILKQVETTESSDIKHSITRFLRYNPINEFEPFFESMGLQPSEYVPLLPRQLTFLEDDGIVLQNYHVLCNYGIARNKIGKIYKEATEVFRYDSGVLMSRLRSYEELRLDQSLLLKVIVSSPTLLTRDVDSALVEVLEKLKNMGFDHCWIEGHLSENDLYNWRQILELLHIFNSIGCSEEQLKKMISENPGLLFEGSSKITLSLIGLLVRFGSARNELLSMFLQFPQVQIKKFVFNIRQTLKFLMELEMEAEEIGKIVRSCPVLLGSCAVKKTNSLLVNLNAGKKRLRNLIIDNPQVLEKWVLGLKVEPLPNSGADLISQQERVKFLLDLGFVEDSKEIKNAMRVFRGKGSDLQGRFDCFVKFGLEREAVIKMVKTSPQIINQSKDVIETKVGFLVNIMGFPVSVLETFPGYLCYTIERVKLRILMYNWLKDQGTVRQMSLSTVLASSSPVFEKNFVNHHPQGPQVWQDMKKQIYSEKGENETVHSLLPQ